MDSWLLNQQEDPLRPEVLKTTCLSLLREDGGLSRRHSSHWGENIWPQQLHPMVVEHTHTHHLIPETEPSQEQQLVICECQTRQKVVSVSVTDGRGGIP